MDVVTIDGSVALTVTRTAKALDCGRSTVYRRIESGELEVVPFDGQPKITARSILKLFWTTRCRHRNRAVVMTVSPSGQKLRLTHPRPQR